MNKTLLLAHLRSFLCRLQRIGAKSLSLINPFLGN